MWKFIRGLASAIGLGGIVSGVLTEWIKNSGIANSPNALLSAIAAAIIWLTGIWWFYPVLAASVIVAIVLWGVYIYSRYVHYRGIAIENLGDEMLKASRTIANRQGGFRNPWPRNISDKRGELAALCAKIRRWRIYAPDESDFDRDDTYDEIFQYFSFVGSYLTNGHRKEAKARALKTKSNLANGGAAEQ